MKQTYTNWGGNVTCTPGEVRMPTTKDQAIALVQEAAREPTKLRVVGSLHSWSQIIACGPQDMLVDTSELNKILSIDTKTKTVWAEGGAKLHTLIDALATAGLALPNQGYITGQSVAGAIATATHGSGPPGSFSRMVTGIQLIDGTGKLRELSATQEPELFAAAQTHLGVCGFIYAVQLQVTDAFALQAKRELTTLDKALEHRGDYNWFMWNPHTQTAVTLQHRSTTQKPSSMGFRFYYDRFKSHLLLKLACFLPLKPPALAELYLKNLACPQYVDDSYRVFSPHQAEPPYLETEMAVAVADVPAAVQDLQKLAQGAPGLAAIFLVRYGPASGEALLDMAAGRDTAYLSVTIGILGKTPPAGALEFLERFARLMIKKYNARPHWGKVYKLSREEFMQLYGGNAKKFVAAREQLDPQGIFLNDYTRELFAH